MAKHSTSRTSVGKAPTLKQKSGVNTPKKPRKNFPLGIHKGTGYWCKKIKGQVYYFGKAADDPKGKAALEQYLAEKDDLEAGRRPRAKDPDAITIADACNEFLEHYEARRDAGEISPRTYQGMHATCANLIKACTKTRAVADLGPDDLGKLKIKLAKTRGAVALRNEMQRCRSVFRYAFVNGLIDREVRYGSKFDKPPLKQVRRNRREQKQEHGARMFEAYEIRLMLDHLSGLEVALKSKDGNGAAQVVEGKQNPALRAMVLLAINCGMGQTDLALLPSSSMNLNDAIIDYPRPKTEAPRLCPLWPKTIAAVREWLPLRPKPKDRADSDLVFLTCRGNRFVKTNKSGSPIDAISQEFNKVLVKLELKRKGVSFYALRHSFRTVADETLDPVATGLIMGHTDSSMAGHYRERISQERLRGVVNHVHSWLWPEDVK